MNPGMFKENILFIGKVLSSERYNTYRYTTNQTINIVLQDLALVTNNECDENTFTTGVLVGPAIFLQIFNTFVRPLTL